MNFAAKQGNVLGELTAEADSKMLETAFHESRAYRELVSGTDFRFVVGRRGSGKSALFRKASEALLAEPGVVLLSEHPTEEKVLALQSELERLSPDYIDARRITRLLWKVQILSDAVHAILAHYKAGKLEDFQYLEAFKKHHANIFAHKGIGRGLASLRHVLAETPNVTARALPERIADQYALNELQTIVVQALRRLGRRIVFLYDGLDEGWLPTQTATGLVGGLVKAAAEFKESADGIHCLLFLRDNMLRALAQFDGDYTRNIEGNTLRLHWDEESLLNLVARRLRAAFSWNDQQDIRIWNRFGQRGLEGREGFRHCLKLTLYRPRDVIALLNGAYQEAGRAGRDRLIETDIDSTATRISRTRLTDLYKEYEKVLPGLPNFAESLRGKPGRMPFARAKSILDDEVTNAHSGASARDFALLSTGDEALNALFSIGFLGIQDEASGAVRFCHDGSNTDIASVAPDRHIFIHPCYWRALDVQDDTPEHILVRVDDEDDVSKGSSAKTEVQDLRLRKLGRIVEELHKIPEGRNGAHAFEEWVLTTSKYLFSTGLDNIQWHPNPGSTQQRDIVGTNRGTPGFWRRLEQNYDVSQFVIECKNFSGITHEGFRQAWGYMRAPYGRCLMVVTRAQSDKITEAERALVYEGWTDDTRKLVFLVPAVLLQRALRKMRSAQEGRDDYIKDLLSKRLDTFERSYVSQKSARRAR